MNSLEEKELKKILDRYRNIKDSDIENFLRKKALIYEKRKWCSVYLLVDEEKLNNGEIFVEGYFTLSNRVLHISDNVSNKIKKKLYNGLKKTGDGFIHVLLIGQLGKYIGKEFCSQLSVNEILDFAFEIIEQVKERIVCNCVILECDIKRVGLMNRYRNYGFHELQQEDSFIQYFAII